MTGTTQLTWRRKKQASWRCPAARRGRGCAGHIRSQTTAPSSRAMRAGPASSTQPSARVAPNRSPPTRVAVPAHTSAPVTAAVANDGR